MQNFVITDKQIEELIDKTVTRYISEKQKADKKLIYKHSKGYKVRALLQSYRSLKIAIANEKALTVEEMKDLRFKFISDLMDINVCDEGHTERLIKAQHLRMKERVYTVNAIEKAMEIYKRECENSPNELDIRKYKALDMLYICEERRSIQEIAEELYTSDKTVYRIAAIACDELAIYLL